MHVPVALSTSRLVTNTAFAIGLTGGLVAPASVAPQGPKEMAKALWDDQDLSVEATWECDAMLTPSCMTWEPRRTLLNFLSPGGNLVDLVPRDSGHPPCHFLLQYPTFP